MGVSVETERYTFRIDHLRSVGATIRFVSAEPLLGPSPISTLEGIDWLIVGGASGPAARPMAKTRARDPRDQCHTADVAFFFKQWETESPDPTAEN